MLVHYSFAFDVFIPHPGDLTSHSPYRASLEGGDQTDRRHGVAWHVNHVQLFPVGGGKH